VAELFPIIEIFFSSKQRQPVRFWTTDIWEKLKRPGARSNKLRSVWSTTLVRQLTTRCGSAALRNASWFLFGAQFFVVAQGQVALENFQALCW